MRLASVPLSDAWAALGGGPLRGKRGKAFWRGGDRYSVALDPEKGAWFDHRDGKTHGPMISMADSEIDLCTSPARRKPPIRIRRNRMA
jgi:hypothetical protein